MPKKRHEIEKGFSLSELLLAAAILVPISCVILYSFITCSFLNESNRNSVHATNHVQYIMEEIKNTDFNEIKSRIESGYWDWNSETITSKGLTPLNNESIDTQVTGSELLDIVVMVNWKDRGKNYRSLSIETLRVKP